LNRHSEFLLERAGHEAKSILTRLFVLCAALLLLYFLLRLMYRYTAAHPSATWYGKTAPALVLLTVVAPIVAIVLAYDHYSTKAPISSGVSETVTLAGRDDLHREGPARKPVASLPSEAPARDIRNDGNHSLPDADTLSTLSGVEKLPSGSTVATGYQSKSVSEPASFASLVPGAETTHTLEPESLRLNQEVVAPELLFAPGRAEITRAFQSTLNEVSKILLNNSEFRIEIRGHTDGRGVASANQRLSEERAMNVAQYLTERGVASDQIWVLGFGSDKPIADNGTVEGRAKNRRVEMRVIR
jgi:outer membrane protein OmpA-like peptidoglycan-associated protein